MALIQALDVLLRGNTQNLDQALDKSVARLSQFGGQVQQHGQAIQTKFSQVGSAISGGFVSQIGNAFVAIRAGMTAPIAALLSLSAILAKTGERANEIKALSREANVLGVSFNFMSAAAALSGTDAETAAHSIQHMLRSVDEFRQGGEESVRVWNRLKISVADLKGQGTEEIFKKLADALSKVKDQGERVALAVKILGRTGAELLPMLSNGAKGVEEAMQKANRLGITLTKEQEATIQSANSAWKEMKTAVTGVFTQLSVVLAPSWQAFARLMTSVLTSVVAKIREWQSMLSSVGIVFEYLAKKWEAFGQWFIVQGTLTLVRIYEDFKDVFTSKIPALFSALAEGLRAWTTGIGENIGDFIGAIFESIATGNKFHFVWQPLENGFQVAMNRIRGIAPREMTALERQLLADMRRLDADLWRDFDAFLRNRIGGAVQAQAGNIAEQFGGGGAKHAKAAEKGSLEELAIRAGDNRDLFAVANAQLREQQGMRRELVRLAGMRGVPVVRANL